MPAGNSIIGDCLECCICPQAYSHIIPEVQALVTFSSLTSSNPQVYGYSAYDDGTFDSDHPERWTYRLSKWRTKQNAGTIIRKDGKCADPDFYTNLYGVYKWIISGSDNLACDGYTSTTKTDRYDQDEPDLGTCHDASVFYFTYTGIDGFPLSQDYFDITTNATSRTYIGKETIPPYNSSAYFGSLASSLNSQSSIYGAIKCDGSAISDSLRCAKNGYVLAFTIPESEDPITLGESTGVTQQFEISALPSTSYSLKITYNNSNAPVADETNPDPIFYDTPDTYDYIDITTDEDGYASFDLDIPDPEGANAKRCFFNIENDAGSEYYIRFPVPKILGGNCFRVSWIERNVSVAESIETVEVFSQGCYRPVVSITGGGGSQGRAIAVMADDGSVDSIHIVSAGTGYTSAPTIEIEPSIGGDSSATGWTATISGGRITSITGGTSGDYMPKIEISFPTGDPSPEISYTMSESGGISSVTVIDGGSSDNFPYISITPKISGSVINADLIPHFETDVNKCQKWNKVVPPGYDETDPETWPSFGPFNISSSIRINYVRSICDCSECP
jgi:hypothetical protein